ncbi:MULTISPECIES: cytochrome P450 [unclassified Nocardioides]|uniref:cytochrome P450 n=1 Tax=unclassified Nocardioides TaxID=2615069 RepID=UPI001172CF19|nr:MULTISPECIES: cytochrome P450 [unclassified Nocardioides]TQK69968.1 cytochrome P450 [Nocardioides sp. SLBN-35]WGY00795.1 cytochrome P450 [Nocardioides sp. QY071]
MDKPPYVPLDQVDLVDLDRFAGPEAWGMLDTLRAEAPVFWQRETDGGHGFWAVTKHADICEVDKDPETFTSTNFVNLEEVEPELQEARRSILEMDGLRHRALRKLISREFSRPNLMRNYEDLLRDITRATVDAALAKGEFDFVEDVSADFPIQVLARLLDVPQEKTGQLIDWGNEIIGFSDPEHAKILISDAESEQYKHLPFRSPVSQEVFDYGRELAAGRRGGEGTDLVSQLVNKIPEDGQAMSASEYDSYFLLLVVAGNETTRHTITHSMLALIEHPEQLAKLQADPSLIPDAVEEFLRWASPVYHFRRTATRDVELGGQEIKEGDKVVMWFASGNRDEDVFENPYDFDVTRKNIDHVTFGKGSPHLCMGNNLARMEIRLMFEELIPRLASIELNGDVRRVRSNFVNGIKTLPVKVTTKD